MQNVSKVSWHLWKNSVALSWKWEVSARDPCPWRLFPTLSVHSYVVTPVLSYILLAIGAQVFLARPVFLQEF